MKLPVLSSITKRSIRPEQVLAIGFLLLILVGAFLLHLPLSSADQVAISFFDSLFTATSAVCVTGLSVIDVSCRLSFFGQVVLLCLIQVGGLGFMCFATLAMAALGKKLSLQGRILLRDSMNQSSLSGMVRLSLVFFGLAVLIELLGCAFLTIRLIPLYGVKRGLWYSFFTAVSSFCNAGFDLFGDSLLSFAREPLVLLPLSFLILLGGIGFPVILEVVHFKRKWRSFSLHAKLVLSISSALLLWGTVLTFLLESSANGAFDSDLSFPHRLLNSFFQSVTLRTAGFESIDQSSLTDSGKLLSSFAMFIGASPASTGGGIKTTTAFSVGLVVWSVIRGREPLTVFGRELSVSIARRAITIVVIGLLMVLGCTCALSVLESDKGFPMIDLFFEAISAFSTTGLSAVGTPALRPASRACLLPLMYLGRVGPLTLAAALAAQGGKQPGIRHPEENIMIG